MLKHWGSFGSKHFWKSNRRSGETFWASHCECFGIENRKKNSKAYCTMPCIEVPFAHFQKLEWKYIRALLNVMVYGNVLRGEARRVNCIQLYLRKSTNLGRHLSFPSSSSQRENWAQRRLGNLSEITQVIGKFSASVQLSFSCFSIYV